MKYFTPLAQSTTQQVLMLYNHLWRNVTIRQWIIKIVIFYFSDQRNKLTKTEGGRYLMSQYSNSGIRENHSRLSRRSKKSIQKLLSDNRMTYCLHQISHNQASFCGDGVVQKGEVTSKYKYNHFYNYNNYCSKIDVP